MTKFKGVSQIKIKRKDRRFIESCFRVLQRQGEQLPPDFETPEEGANIIEELIASKKVTFEEKEKMIQSLIAGAEQSLLSLDELDWIKDNERACYFLWASIYLYYYYSAPSHPAIVTPGQQPTKAELYDQLRLKNNPSDTVERFNEVVKYFDRIQQPNKWKLDLIAYLKDAWGQIFSSRKPFPWLEKDNDEQCRWAWEYMKKSDGYSRLKPMNYRFTPTSTAEIYLTIYALYDTWNIAPDTKKLFSIDFNKAWQQKKHRDNLKGKKACNLVLREDVKNMLDELAKVKGVKLNQFVEQLIEK